MFNNNPNLYNIVDKLENKMKLIRSNYITNETIDNIIEKKTKRLIEYYNVKDNGLILNNYIKKIFNYLNYGDFNKN